MNDPSDAAKLIVDNLQPLQTEEISVHASLGRVLATSISARHHAPARDVSAMDGYAIRALDNREAGQKLTVSGQIPAGSTSPPALKAGHCARIFTGAPMPSNADAVIPQEIVEREANTIRTQKASESGANVRRRGSDLRSGDELASPGVRIGAAEIAASLSQRVLYLEVYRKPEVALLASGDELKRADDLDASAIIETNTWMVGASIESDGGVARRMPLSADRDEDIRRALEQAAESDIIVTLGGASVGDHDRLRPVLESLGAEFHFQKVRLKPGKPVHFATWEGRPIILLPGNPASALVGYHAFVRPALRKLSGDSECFHPVYNVTIGAGTYSAGSRPEIVRAFVDMRDGEFVASLARSQSSGSFGSICGQNAMLHLSPNQAIEPGSDVTAWIVGDVAANSPIFPADQ